MDDVVEVGEPPDLREWQERLASHFRALAETRVGYPIYALEHGLADDDRRLLVEAVRAELGRGAPRVEWWLPFVVYATEIGYGYSGEDYWPTFAEATPGWLKFGDREFVRRWFTRFRDTYRGAEPRGPWAEQFRIIAWPITHAILPADLQQSFARLLHDSRSAFTRSIT